MFLNMSKKGWFEDGVFIQPKFMKFLSGIGISSWDKLIAHVIEFHLTVKYTIEIKAISKNEWETDSHNHR